MHKTLWFHMMWLLLQIIGFLNFSFLRQLVIIDLERLSNDFGIANLLILHNFLRSINKLLGFQYLRLLFVYYLLQLSIRVLLLNLFVHYKLHHSLILYWIWLFVSNLNYSHLKNLMVADLFVFLVLVFRF